LIISKLKITEIVANVGFLGIVTSFVTSF